MDSRNIRNARQAMERSKIPNSRKVVSLLFETFIENRGKLKSAEVYLKGLCKKGEFYQWRQELSDKGWLVFEIDRSGKFANYYPGKKLLKYINKEKAESHEMATSRDLKQLEKEIDIKLKEQEKDILDKVVKLFNPPVDEKKVTDLKDKLKLVKD